MLTDEEMGRLEAAPAVEFDPLFLELMIKHHRGALTMVETLLSQRGSRVCQNHRAARLSPGSPSSWRAGGLARITLSRAL